MKIIWIALLLLVIAGCTKQTQSTTTNEENASYTDLEENNEFHDELAGIEGDLNTLFENEEGLNLSDDDFNISFD